MTGCKPAPLPSSGIGAGQDLLPPHSADTEYLITGLICSGEVLKGLINIVKLKLAKAAEFRYLCKVVMGTLT